MESKKGISGINLIVAAVIGLIIIVVIIIMLTGKLGSFGEGISKTSSCENICTSLGKIYSTIDSRSNCESFDGSFLGNSAQFDDVIEGQVCCCQ